MLLTARLNCSPKKNGWDSMLDGKTLSLDFVTYLQIIEHVFQWKWFIYNNGLYALSHVMFALFMHLLIQWTFKRDHYMQDTVLGRTWLQRSTKYRFYHQGVCKNMKMYTPTRQSRTERCVMKGKSNSVGSSEEWFFYPSSYSSPESS